MTRKILLALSPALVVCAFAQAPAPNSTESAAMIARIQEAALNFQKQLQNFVCLQQTVRTANDSGDGKRWKPLETQELELTYVQHKERYNLLKVNGQTTNTEKRIKGGYFRPSGEFGTALDWIFNPKANASFEWEHACTLRYRVPVATTTLVMTVNLDKVPMGHSGIVEADCGTGMVTHVHIESDPASDRMKGHDVAVGLELDVRYGPVNIGSKEFFVPLTAKETALFAKTRTKAEIQFQQYRKYDSNATITFGDAGH